MRSLKKHIQRLRTMQENTENQLPSGKKGQNTSSSKQVPPSQQGSQSYVLFQSITKLHLFRYKDCAVYDNLSALIISGEPPRKALEMAWLEIQQQFADAVGDAEYSNYVRMAKEVTLLNCTYTQIQLCAKNLEMIFNFYFDGPDTPFYQTACEYIEIFGRDINRFTGSNFSFIDKATFHSNIKRCINRSKGLKLELDFKNAQFEVIRQKFEKEGKKPDEQYFDAILIGLSDHAGYQLTDQITVFEFCSRLKRLNNASGSPKSVRK